MYIVSAKKHMQSRKNPKEILFILDKKSVIVARWNLTNQIKYVGGIVLNDISKAEEYVKVCGQII